MTKFEEKVLDLITKHRFVLGYIVVTAFNLFIRKTAVWWNTDGITLYYDGHDHMVQGQLWWLIMRLGMLFPILPLHFMKWVATAGDFAMAAVGARLLSKNDSPERGLVFYSLILIMPFTLMRGIVWSMTDSCGIACFLLAHSFEAGEKTKARSACMIVAYALGILFCPQLILILCFESIYRSGRSLFGICALTAGCAAVLSVTVAGIIGLANGFGFSSGVLGQVNFLTFNTLTGASFEDGISWMLAQMWLLCLPISALTLFGIVKKRDR